MNSTVGPSFEIVFAEKSTCRFREQCTRPTGEHETQLKVGEPPMVSIHTNSVCHLLLGWGLGPMYSVHWIRWDCDT